MISNIDLSLSLLYHPKIYKLLSVQFFFRKFFLRANQTLFKNLI